MQSTICKFQKTAISILLVLIVISCKSKKIAATVNTNENLSAKTIIKGHYKNQQEFKTLRGRMKINYSDGLVSQVFNVSIRLEKDKTMWISAPFGIVKAYITPDRVSFYNKLNNTFFDGNFSYLSELLGIELDFEKVQNVLLGYAILDLRDKKYQLLISDNYQLIPKKADKLFKILFQLEPSNFRVSLLQLLQPKEKRLLEIEYKDYQKTNKRSLPNKIRVVSLEGNSSKQIDIIYKDIEFDRNLNFPYKIPKGFKEIMLK